MKKVLVVVVLVALLSWLSIRLARPRDQAKTCRLNIKTIVTALELYSTDNQGDYPRSLAVLTPNYLKSVLVCPAVEADTYSASYEVSGFEPDKDGQETPDVFTVYCKGENHAAAGLPANNPRYNIDDYVMDR